MKKSLLQRAKSRIAKMMRPKKKSSRKYGDRLLQNLSLGMTAVAPVTINTGPSIEQCRARRGKVGFPRPSRSKYHLNPESGELNIAFV